jgi:hypothetical protein
VTEQIYSGGLTIEVHDGEPDALPPTLAEPSLTARAPGDISEASMVLIGAAFSKPVRDLFREFALDRMWKDNGALVPQRWAVKPEHARNWFRQRLSMIPNTDIERAARASAAGDQAQ